MTQGKHHNHGFTLLEMLVVVMIFALLAGLTGVYSGGRDSASLDSIAKILMADLRHERSKALISGADSALTFDLEEKVYYSRDSKTTRRIPEHIQLAILLDEKNIASGSGRILFYPDGSSSGGRVHLTSRGRSMEVSTSWLNGYVSVDGG